MVFKPSFKCLKHKKINFIQAIPKPETFLHQSIYILFHLILHSQCDFDSKKKKWSNRKKNMPIQLLVTSLDNDKILLSSRQGRRKVKKSAYRKFAIDRPGVYNFLLHITSEPHIFELSNKYILIEKFSFFKNILSNTIMCYKT